MYEHEMPRAKECFPGALRCSVCDRRAVAVADVEGDGWWVIATCAIHTKKS